MRMDRKSEQCEPAEPLNVQLLAERLVSAHYELPRIEEDFNTAKERLGQNRDEIKRLTNEMEKVPFKKARAILVTTQVCQSVVVLRMSEAGDRVVVDVIETEVQ